MDYAFEKPDTLKIAEVESSRVALHKLVDIIQDMKIGKSAETDFYAVFKQLKKHASRHSGKVREQARFEKAERNTLVWRA
jgi:hypothetical protein